jgi:hypothetical protein
MWKTLGGLNFGTFVIFCPAQSRYLVAISDFFDSVQKPTTDHCGGLRASVAPSDVVLPLDRAHCCSLEDHIHWPQIDLVQVSRQNTMRKTF